MKEEATISPFDHGFIYGLGAFETFRIYEGFPFLIDNHIDSFNEALGRIEYSIEIDDR